MVNERSFSNATPGHRGKVKAVEATARATARARAPKAPRPARRKTREVNPEHRGQILEVAEALFSTKGFHGTGLREIATAAGISLGNIYNHFPTKEALFEALLDELEKKYLDPSQPLPRALTEIQFPMELEKLGEAARETVEKFAAYIRLIYVDVIEFEGAHVARVYGQMMDRYRKVFADRIDAARRRGELSEADPLVAVMMSTIVYMYYFTVEHLFGVRRHYGLDDDQVIREFAKVFRLGILKR